MAKIWLRYRDDVEKPTVNLREYFDLERIAIVAREKKKVALELGEDKLQDAIVEFANRLGDAATQSNDDDVELRAAELCTLIVLRALEYEKMPYALLEDATIECMAYRETGALSYHLALAHHPSGQRNMCFSVELDAFLSEHNNAQGQSITKLGTQGHIIDTLIRLYDDLNDCLRNQAPPDPVIISLLTAVKQDIAFACSIALGQRSDAAFTLARRALEISGVIRIITHNPEASNVWAAAHNGNEDWKEFKKTFTVKNYFPSNDAFWKDVFVRYDHLARFFHPNPSSFWRTEWSETEDQRLRITVHQLEGGNDADTKNNGLRSMWYVLDCYALALRAMEKTQRPQLIKDPDYDLHNEIADCSKDIIALLA